MGAVVFAVLILATPERAEELMSASEPVVRARHVKAA
jgi:hypothetical protein